MKTIIGFMAGIVVSLGLVAVPVLASNTVTLDSLSSITLDSIFKRQKTTLKKTNTILNNTSGIKKKITSNGRGIGAVQSSIDTVGVSLNSVQTSVTGMQETVGALQSTLTTLQTTTAEANTASEETEQKLLYLQGLIEDIYDASYYQSRLLNGTAYLGNINCILLGGTDVGGKDYCSIAAIADNFIDLSLYNYEIGGGLNSTAVYSATTSEQQRPKANNESSLGDFERKIEELKSMQ